MWLKTLLVLFALGFVNSAFAACGENNVSLQSTNQNSDSRYDYVYKNPARQSLGVYGRYIFSNSTVRYVQSPSRLKQTAHAARIDANNRLYEN